MVPKGAWELHLSGKLESVSGVRVVPQEMLQESTTFRVFTREQVSNLYRSGYVLLITNKEDLQVDVV